MNVLPDVIFFSIERIKELAQKIKRSAERVKANKHQCKSLSDRVSRITDALYMNTQTKGINPRLSNALNNFCRYLDQCYDFVQKFEKEGWFSRIKNNRDYSREFRRLNEELSYYCQDLQLSIALHGVFSPVQDNLDAIQDLKEVEQIITRVQNLNFILELYYFIAFSRRDY